VTLVDGDVLSTHKVLASRDALLDGPLQAVLLPSRPGSVSTRGARVAEAGLHDLGPLARAVVVVDLAGSLGDVDKATAGVLDLLVVGKLEAELVAGLDSVGAGAAGLSTLVAAEVGGVDNLAGEGRHVRVAVLAGVGVVTTDGGAVDDE